MKREFRDKRKPYCYTLNKKNNTYQFGGIQYISETESLQFEIQWFPEILSEHIAQIQMYDFGWTSYGSGVEEKQMTCELANIKLLEALNIEEKLGEARR